MEISPIKMKELDEMLELCQISQEEEKLSESSEFNFRKDSNKAEITFPQQKKVRFKLIQALWARLTAKSSATNYDINFFNIAII